jgi:hypothetical protein
MVGANVAQEETFAEKLQDIYLHDPKGFRKMVNASTDGWKPFRYAEYYEHYGQLLDPDLIIVGFFVGNYAYGP